MAKSSASGSLGSNERSIDLQYGNQYFFELTENMLAGGSVTPSNGWYNPSESVPISAMANQGWKFDRWMGNGTVSSNGGSYSLQVNGAVNETAEFFAALVLSASPNGQLQYGYGATSGVVDAGSSQTIYVAPSTSVARSATPSSLFYSVSGWGNQSAGTSPTSSIDVLSPAQGERVFRLQLCCVRHNWFNISYSCVPSWTIIEETDPFKILGF
ncbi:MAG: hypothetical protein ACHQ1H_00570 [Nitrososphaerales archaeon]